MNQGTQISGNTANTISVNTITPQQNATPNPVQTNQVQSGKTNIKTKKVKPVKEKKRKKKSNPLTLLIILAIAVVGIFLFINNKSGNIGIGAQGNQIVSKEKIETGTKWGDDYAYYIQKFFDKLEIMEIAFVDFDDDQEPEMILKYKDVNQDEAMMFFYIYENNVYESKKFYDGTFKILYSLKNHESKWYLYLASSKNYGAYTSASKLMNGIAYDSDIKVNNMEEKKKFNANYMESNFTVTYYNVDKKKFIEDFETVVSRYDKYSIDIKNEKDKLHEEFKDTLSGDKVEKETHIKVGEFNLPYGTYTYGGTNFANNVHTIIIYDAGLISIDDISYKFSINLNGYFELDNGHKVAIADNNTLVYKEMTFKFSKAN